MFEMSDIFGRSSLPSLSGILSTFSGRGDFWSTSPQVEKSDGPDYLGQRRNLSLVAKVSFLYRNIEYLRQFCWLPKCQDYVDLEQENASKSFSLFFASDCHSRVN